MEPTQEKKSNGALIGSIIIILVLIIGGIYVWTTQMKTEVPDTMMMDEQQNTAQDAAAIEAYDSLSGIEQDINNTQSTDVSVDVESVQ